MKLFGRKAADPAAVQATIEAVCALPIAFHQRGDVSGVDLLRESGYAERARAIQPQLLEQHLRANPGLIEAWLDHSADQRTDAGHYFRPPDAGVDAEAGWAVGYTSARLREAEQVFPDRYAACAYFIKEYLELLRRWL